MKLTARLDPEQLEQLAELVVRKLLASQRSDTYDQDHLPVGITRRAYLEAARRGAFHVAKVGKKLITQREVLDQWIASHARTQPVVHKPARLLDLDPEIAETIAANGARCR